MIRLRNLIWGEAVNIIEERKFFDWFGDEERMKKECAEIKGNINEYSNHTGSERI